MIRIEVNDAGVRARLQRLHAEASDRRVPNRQLSVQLYGWTIRNFQSGGSSQVPVWAPLAASTLKQKQRKGYSSLPLTRSGHLRQSFRGFSDNDKAGVGSEVSYSQYHQSGTRRMPARPMLPPENVARELAIRVYDKWIITIAK